MAKASNGVGGVDATVTPGPLPSLQKNTIAFERRPPKNSIPNTNFFPFFPKIVRTEEDLRPSQS